MGPQNKEFLGFMITSWGEIFASMDGFDSHQKKAAKRVCPKNTSHSLQVLQIQLDKTVRQCPVFCCVSQSKETRQSGCKYELQ